MRNFIIILVLLVIGAVAYVVSTNWRPQIVPVVSTATTTDQNGDPYADESSWQQYQNATAGWSIAYPGDFTATRSPDFILTIPKSFEPGTNFGDAKLTVIATTTSDCVPAVATSSDAGAGNLYDTTTYKRANGTTCYTLEYTIHSTQLANYPAELHLQQFDASHLHSVLDRIVGTFVIQ
jgi:hypothetical protein